MSSKPRIDQLLPAAHDGDAAGTAAVKLAEALRAAGYSASIYALTIDAPMRKTVQPVSELPPRRSKDVTVLHFALPSPLSRLLCISKGRKVVLYHNLTPPELLLTHCPEIARLTALGRRELRELANSGKVDLAIGVSRFNTRDLDKVRFARTMTLPLPLDLGQYDVAPDPVVLSTLDVSQPLFLTVGRVAPNKRLEDVLRIAAYYLRHVSPNARFAIVGSTRGLETYVEALLRLHRELDLDERVRILGHVPADALAAYYRSAAVYLCTSEHEGFCAPLLEAMHFGLPVLSRKAAAVPETLGGAGLLFDSASTKEIGEMLHLLTKDAELRSRLIKNGRRRLKKFGSPAVLPRWVTTLGELTGSDL